MNVTCPSCGADMDLDVLLSHEESRQALGTLAMLTVPLAKRTLQYVRLFKPLKRAMGHGRTVKLIAELLPDLQRGAITHKGREWAAPHDAWATAIDRILERRDAGRLGLPLTSHVYLYETLVGIADAAEAVDERETEATRRGARASGAATNLQPAAASLQSEPSTSQPAVAILAPISTPSAYALRVRAQIEAEKKRREAASSAADGDTR